MDNDPFALQFAIENSRELLQSQRRTLICCSAGFTRNSLIAFTRAS